MKKYILYKTFNTRSGEYLQRLKSGFRHYVLNYPTTIVVQTVASCNLPCTHCFVNNFGKEIPDAKKTIMKLDDFKILLKRIEKVIRKADYMGFSTFEALFNKQLFDMMAEVLKVNPKIKFPFLSNSMLLTEENILKLKQMPITEINISLDGLKKETVEAFKTGVDHGQIINAIKTLGKHGLSHITAVTFVAHKDNIAELPDYVDFVNSLDVKRIYVNNLLSFTGHLKGKYLYTEHGNAYAESIFRETVKRVKANGQEIWLPGLKPEINGCTQPETLFINYNGDVAPCDYLSASTPFEYFGDVKVSKPVVFGNVFKDDALEIYRSQQASNFRKMHRNNKLPGPCDHCIDGYGLMCSKRKLYS